MALSLLTSSAGRSTCVRRHTATRNVSSRPTKRFVRAVRPFCCVSKVSSEPTANDVARSDIFETTEPIVDRFATMTASFDHSLSFDSSKKLAAAFGDPTMGQKSVGLLVTAVLGAVAADVGLPGAVVMAGFLANYLWPLQAASLIEDAKSAVKVVIGYATALMVTKTKIQSKAPPQSVSRPASPFNTTPVTSGNISLDKISFGFEKPSEIEHPVKIYDLSTPQVLKKPTCWTPQPQLYPTATYKTTLQSPTTEPLIKVYYLANLKAFIKPLSWTPQPLTQSFAFQDTPLPGVYTPTVLTPPASWPRKVNSSTSVTSPPHIHIGSTQFGMLVTTVANTFVKNVEESYIPAAVTLSPLPSVNFTDPSVKFTVKDLGTSADVALALSKTLGFRPLSIATVGLHMGHADIPRPLDITSQELKPTGRAGVMVSNPKPDTYTRKLAQQQEWEAAVGEGGSVAGGNGRVLPRVCFSSMSEVLSTEWHEVVVFAATPMEWGVQGSKQVTWGDLKLVAAYGIAA